MPNYAQNNAQNSAQNYRPPPPQLSNTQLNQVSSWCRYDPWVCVRAVGIETLFVAASYCAVLYLTGGVVPRADVVLKFMGMFGMFTLAARMVSDDVGNKIGISAIAGVGNKIVAVLAPRFVGW